MEDLFENKTKYSEKVYNIFLKSYEEEYSKVDNLYMIYNIVFFGTCMFFAFIEKEIILGICILIGLLIYMWYKFIRPIKREKKTRKSPKMNGNYVNTYRFYKNYFDVKNPDGDAQIAYFKIYRMVETKEYYYIYISREHAFVVSKFGFTKGDYMEFSIFMRKLLKRKYKNRIKK